MSRAGDVAGLPLWYQVTQSLRTGILGRGPDDPVRLPTEADLARHYGVSLATVRQALANLEREGLITRHRRRGTFVNAHAVPDRVLRVLGDVETIFDQQASDEVRLLSRATGPPRDGFTGDVEVFRRLRLDDGQPVSYAQNVLPAELGARIQDADLERQPMTKVLRDVLGLPLQRVDNVVEATTATPELAGLLGVALLSPILLSVNRTYTADGSIVDAARIAYRGDRFRYAVSLRIP